MVPGSCTKVAHNLKYDLHILLNARVKIRGPFEDTMLMSYVLEANRKHDLATLAERHLGRSGQTYEELTGKGAKQICFSEVQLLKLCIMPVKMLTLLLICILS